MRADIVIVGGGFDGLEAAFSLKSLVDDACEVTLLDRKDYHSFIPAIHEISSGKISVRSIEIPLETILAPAGIRFVRDEVMAIDRVKRRVTAVNGSLDYDYLVVSTGAENNFFGVPGAEEHAFRFRRPDDAVRIHDHLAQLLAEDRNDVHVVVAGGGTEGVEVAGELLDLISDSGREEDLSRGTITISLVEAQQQLLPGFPPRARTFVEDYLRKQGVTVITGQRITAVRAGSVSLATGTELPRSEMIWSGGIKPSRLIDGLELPKDEAGWLIVTDRLHSPADDRLYAVGDIVTIQGPDGLLPLPRLAYHAQDQAVMAGINISYDLYGKDLIRYSPRYKPRLVSIGRNMGIYSRGDVFRSGKWVVGMKKAVERGYLLSCLARPLTSGVSRRIPGGDILKLLGLKLPF